VNRSTRRVPPPHPPLLYGSSFKEERTQELVEVALLSGFRGIDSGNFRRNYVEEAVGEAVQALISKGVVRREELFLQSKFAHSNAHDHRLPYDPSKPIGEQVLTSLTGSLKALRTENLEALLLQSPWQGNGLTANDWDAWRAMEKAVDDGRVKFLGICNVNAGQLQELLAQARIKPSFVQNRCYAARAWDQMVRWLCNDHSIRYQACALVSANQKVIEGAATRVGASLGKSPWQVTFRFAVQMGMLPVSGSSNPRHMKELLENGDFQLPPEAMTAMASAQ
jgi:diketogulonate reductase-like aldo/keto reductase